LVTPTTWISAFILLLLSVVCLGSWPNAFKRAGRWRFELFSCDFAIGALLFSVVAAYTLGTLGSALSFADRMLVAGRTNQGLAIIAGACFALANMLFLSSVSLLGLAAAFPLTIGTACAVAAAAATVLTPGPVKASSLILLAAGIGMLILTTVLDTKAAQKRGAALGASSGAAVAKTTGKLRVSTKGLLSGAIGGMALGVCLPVIGQSSAGDLGLGPYGGLLLFSIGLFGATFVLNFYFMNIAIHGGPITFNAYFQGNVRQHLLGMVGGGFWAGGALLLGLALSVPPVASLSTEMRFMLPPLSALLAMFWGLIAWKEYAVAPAAAKTTLYLAALFFVAEVVLLGMAVA
jgi:glucose uptake protein